MQNPSSAINSNTVTFFTISFSLFFNENMYGYAASYDRQILRIEGGSSTFINIFYLIIMKKNEKLN